MTDKDEFDNAIKYFQNIISNNLLKYSQHKLGATFVGIKTNISGTFKLHIYIILFPFIKKEEIQPYSSVYPNIYLKDIYFNVDENFYLWIYEEMRKKQSIIIMTLENNIWKMIEGFGDALISIDKRCNEKKEWMELEFNEWYEKNVFNNVFILKITNPYLYIVPFPVKHILLKTEKSNYNYCKLYQE
jgi:hypothetical protein